MNESSALGVRWHISCGCILETLDDRLRHVQMRTDLLGTHKGSVGFEAYGFTTAVMAYNHR